MTWSRRTAFASLLVIALIVLARAQVSTPVGIDLSGKWTLDTYLSDNPQQVAAAIRADLSRAAGDEVSFGGFDTGGPNRGRMGGRGQRGGPQRPEEPNTEDQNRLNELTAVVRYPPPVLTIAQATDTVTFTDGQGRTRTLQSNGKREKQTLDSTPVESITRWEGPQLVVEYDLSMGRKMIHAYSIVPTTKQLLLRIAFERSTGQRTVGQRGPFEIRYVYNRAAGP